MPVAFFALRRRAFAGLILALGAWLPLALAQSTTAGWAQAEIGAVGAAGGASESGGAISVSGSGADIWNNADAFHYFYQPWNGDGVFVVRVTGLTFTDAWAKAGIMLRTDLGAGAAHVFVSVNPNQYASAIQRDTAGGASTITAALRSEDRFMPMWLKLRRNGDKFAFAFSGDGLTWRELGTVVTLPFASSVLVGLAVTSHLDGTLATATFDNLNFQRLAAGPVTAVARAPTRIDLSWPDEFLSETGWELERSTDNAAFAPLAKTGPSAYVPLSVRDADVAPSSTYYYRVRAITPAGPSDYSPTVAATTPPPPPAGWLAFDIGATAVGGSTRESGGIFTLQGSGRGVGGVPYDHESTGKGDFTIHTKGSSDEFQFCGQAWSGDGEMVARVTGLSGTDVAQAGVVVRAGTEAIDGYAFVGAIGAGGLTMLTRKTDATPYRETATRYAAASGAPRPLWVKLVRQFGGVMGYASADGATWQELAWSNNPLPAQVYFALAASSRVSGTLATATFDNVRVGPVTIPIPPPPAPAAFAVKSIRADAIEVQWDNRGFVYDRLEVEYSADGANFKAAGSVELSRSATATGLQPDTTYTLRLRGFRGTQPSEYVTITARTDPAPVAPQNLSATAVNGAIELRWADPNNGRASLYLERSTDNVAFSFRNYVDGTSFVDTYAINAGGSYYYRMRAISGSLTSAFSNTASAVGGTPSPTGGPTITQQPGNQVAAVGGTATFTVAAAANAPTYQWFRNGQAIAGATAATLAFGADGRPGVQLSDAGLYTVAVTDGTTSVSWAGILGIASSAKVIGSGAEVGPNIVHANGNVYDQVLLQGPSATITADAGQVTRISFIDLSDDIVQVEFSGNGTLTINLENASGPAAPVNYNQPDVRYMKGHASIVIAGADASTNVSVFSVGRANAVNPALFRDGVAYDGVADIASLTIATSGGRFGGIRTANTSYVATHGVAGIYAPNITFLGPIYVGDVSAADTAQPTLLFSTDGEIQINGGDLAQANGRPVQTSGLTRLRFVDGTTSHGNLLPAQPCRARIIDAGGSDVTARMVTSPP